MSRVVAFVTLVAFWNGLLQTSFAKAQSAGAEPGTMSRSDGTATGSGRYDEATLEKLSSHVGGESSGSNGGSEDAPGALAEADKALAALPSGGGVSPQATAMPSGAATQLGMGESFSTQLSTGGAGYSIPIAMPAARGGVQPRLEVSYSSGGGFGVAGIGWSFGVSAISRQTDRGVPSYDDRASWHPEQDRFVFGGMELVPLCTVSGGSCAGALSGEAMPSWANGWQYFRARIEGGYLRFFWSPDHLTWRVQGKDGTNLELGVPQDGSGYQGGLERNPADASEIFRWHLTREYDMQGSGSPAQPVNAIVYRYMTDGNTAYLTDVFDTSPASNPTTTNLAQYAHHTSIAYEARPDTVTSYRSGYLVEAGLRLSRVDVTSKPWSGGVNAARELVRRYYFGYDTSAHYSLLKSVQMEGRCSTAVQENGSQAVPLTSCERLPAITLEYQGVAGDSSVLSDSQGYAFDAINHEVKALSSSPPYSLDEKHTGLVDINADGLPDVLVTAAGSFGGKHGLYLNGSGVSGVVGFGGASTMAVLPAADVTDANVLSLSSPNVAALDLDADGQVNLVHMPQAKRYSVFTAQATGGGGYQWVGHAVNTASQQDVKIDFTRDASNVRVMDVNGDGLVDIVYSSATELQTFFSLGRYPGGDGQFGSAVRTSATNATISNDPVEYCIPWSSTPVRFSDPDTQLADMNGDGLVDIVRVRSGQVLYWPGRGNGYFGTGSRQDCSGEGFSTNRHVEMQQAPQFGTAQPGTLLLNDVNGDGYADMVEVRNQGVDIYLNDNGQGWTPRHIIEDTPFRPSDSNYVRLTDIDGSGTPDILWGRAGEYKYIDLDGGKVPHLLTKVSNGLGKTSELEYASSASLMLAAAAAGTPWTDLAPITTPVLIRSTVRDHLEKLGRAAGVYVTEYSYSGAVYEGRQHEFRGFRQAVVKAVGDASSPSSYERTTFNLGKCPPQAYSALGSCSDANWREALKGLAAVVESYDDQGVYHSTRHTKYALKQLYTGVDGRAVTSAQPVESNVFAYETSPGAFDHVTSTILLPDIDVQVSQVTQLENRSVTLQATSGTARLRAQTVYDNFGNVTDSIRYGCVSGCPGGVDEVITSHSDFALASGDTSGWLWRDQHSYVTGSVNTARRHERVNTYNATGNLEESYGVLSGTLALDRFHETSQPIAPSPPSQSGGTGAAVQVLLVDNSYDAFGHVTFKRVANNGCSGGDYDPDYAHLPVTARSYGGTLNTGTNCGNNTFSSSVTYDRGLEVPVTSVDARGQPSRYDFDNFGRLWGITKADPNAPGQLAANASVLIGYGISSDPVNYPHAITVIQTLDGADPNTNLYKMTWRFTDGLGREIVTLSTGDSSAGDTTDAILGGSVAYSAKGEVIRRYDPWFYTDTSFAGAFAADTVVPTTPFRSQEYDAFGNVIRTYGYDVQPESMVVPHPLSTDVYDAADILATAHQNTYATTVADGHGRAVRRIERIKNASQVVEQRLMINEYLPTGEVFRATQRLAGSPDVVRWMKYDTLGRMVLNVEPNTSVGFNPDPNTAPSSIKAFRYAYDDAGHTVGFSDARGCGANYHYDTAGRLVAEDRSPCLAAQAAYTAPNLSTGDGTEVFHRYDSSDPDTSSIVDGANHTLSINSTLLWGRAVSVSSLASKLVYQYDALGRPTGVGLRVQKPGPAASALATRYAPRWYIKTQTLDAANRITKDTTGATTPELMGPDGSSEVRVAYSRRGTIKQIDSSYGTLFKGEVRLADGRVQSFTLGDATSTQRYYTYDVRHRVQDMQTYRASIPLWSAPPPGSSYTPPAPTDDPTRQLLLEDNSFVYDEVGNIIQVQDHRIDADWPAGAKPVTRTFEYDDLYRLTRTTYQYAPSGTDSWKSPYAAELQDTTLPQPSPYVSLSARPTEQRYRYDWLGNISQETDDQSSFWDRSTGDRVAGTTSSGPHRILSASNRALSPASPNKGDMSVGYDAAGNMSGLVVRRDGTCLPTGASCWQRFTYEWDELGELVRARRWDLTAAERTNNGQLTQAVPGRTSDVELRYYYDDAGQRVLKTAIDKNGVQKHAIYIFNSLEVRSADWSATSGDYVLSPDTVSVRLFASYAKARVIYSSANMPSLTTSRQHVLLTLADQLGSTCFVIDYATGELVENSTYQTYGAAESDYRPNRWKGFREAYRFTGKEEDIEVGLQYFGARYYSPYVGVWISPDPASIHSLESDPNPYAYVHGTPMMASDPDGRFAFLIVLAIILVSAALSAGVNATVQYINTGHVQFWGAHGVAAAFGIGLVAGAATLGVGGLVSGAVGGGLAGALAGGVAGGVAGGAAGYVAGYAFGGDFSAKGFGLAVLGGAIAGAAGGTAGFALGDALHSGLVGAIAGGAAGGTASWLFGGVVSHDWSASSFALSAGIGMAAAVASYGVSEALKPAEPAQEYSTKGYTVRRNGNEIQIEVRIKYSGAGATPVVIKNFNDAIANQWSGSFGQYDVNTTVDTVVDPSDAFEIEIKPGNSSNNTPSFMDATKDALGNITPKGTGTWYAGDATNQFRDANGNPEQLGWTGAHETGHGFGLPDMYTTTYVNGQRVTTPIPGWVGDIMAQHGGHVSTWDLDQILNRAFH